MRASIYHVVHNYNHQVQYHTVHTQTSTYACTCKHNVLICMCSTSATCCFHTTVEAVTPEQTDASYYCGRLRLV
jgi:hypothetical protein